MTLTFVALYLLPPQRRLRELARLVGGRVWNSEPNGGVWADIDDRPYAVNIYFAILGIYFLSL